MIASGVRPASDAATNRRGFWAIMAVALAIRLILSARTIVHQPDEVWQYLEPAYGLVTGRWIVAWEFHEHIRGWLIPMMLYPVVALGHALAPASQLHIWLVRIVLSLLSLGVVAAFYELAGRFGRQHALIAAWVAAVWPEIFYFAPRSSAEAIALSLLMPAIALLYRLRERASFATAVLAGFLLVLGAIARFQYLPAIVLIAAWGAYDHCRKLWLPLLIGNGLALALGALADLAAGQPPYVWIWTNYAINMGQSRSAFFGTAGPDWYLLKMIETWGWCAPVLLPGIALGARRLPMLLAMALVIIVVHMLVPHKEYRFVLLAVILLVLLAAVGTVDCAQWLARRFPKGKDFAMPLLAAIWAAMAFTIAATQPFYSYWFIGHDALTAQVEAGRRPDICALAFFRIQSHPRATYAFFNRDLPMLLFDGPIADAAAQANRNRFNVAIAPRLSAPDLPPGYRLDHCMSPEKPAARQQNCIYARSGGCSGGSGDFDYNRVLARLGH